MLDTDFFVPEVDFVVASSARKRRTGHRLLFGLQAWGAAVVIVSISAQATGASDLRLVRSVIMRSHPSPELTPEVVALYREFAAEDRELAEMGLADYGLMGDAEGT